jgi:hypothetical protein
MHSRRVMLIALAAFVVVAAVLWIPWATKSRVVIASTPVPAPLFGITPAPLAGGATACMQGVTFDPQTEIGEIGFNTKGKPGPRLAITASAPGYRATSQIRAGDVNNPSARFEIAAPTKSVIGKLCIRNTGKQEISLNGTTEFRTMGRPVLYVNGQQQQVDPTLIFYARGRGSYLSRAGQILRHAAIFTPPFLSRWLLALIGLVALAGVPLAIAVALKKSVEADRQTD